MGDSAIHCTEILHLVLELSFGVEWSEWRCYEGSCRHPFIAQKKSDQEIQPCELPADTAGGHRSPGGVEEFAHRESVEGEGEGTWMLRKCNIPQ